MNGQRQPIELVVANMRNSGLTANYVADKLYAFQRQWGWEYLDGVYHYS